MPSKTSQFFKLYGYDLLLGSFAAFYVLKVPYTKVEESFNVQYVGHWVASYYLHCGFSIFRYVLFFCLLTVFIFIYERFQEVMNHLFALHGQNFCIALTRS
ncbi:hypothetical protein Pint_07262 [Pistacia integerrima]|uniref:Uncharacterized protein n=1 Tax=Pistacia integerrima TaxID=434235 RepID=A0ACC0XVP7_9ROSI|nr:hypothetical protein Pint_07262 [Pistacia integerrima]